MHNARSWQHFMVKMNSISNSISMLRHRYGKLWKNDNHFKTGAFSWDESEKKYIHVSRKCNTLFARFQQFKISYQIGKNFIELHLFKEDVASDILKVVQIFSSQINQCLLLIRNNNSVDSFNRDFHLEFKFLISRLAYDTVLMLRTLLDAYNSYVCYHFVSQLQAC